MRQKKITDKRKKLAQTDDEPNSKHRKINVPTYDTNNNSESCLTRRHEMLVDMVILPNNNN